MASTSFLRATASCARPIRVTGAWRSISTRLSAAAWPRPIWALRSMNPRHFLETSPNTCRSNPARTAAPAWCGAGRRSFTSVRKWQISPHIVEVSGGCVLGGIIALPTKQSDVRITSCDLKLSQNLRFPRIDSLMKLGTEYDNAQILEVTHLVQNFLTRRSCSARFLLCCRPNYLQVSLQVCALCICMITRHFILSRAGRRPTVDLGMSEKVTKLEVSHIPGRYTGLLVSRYRVS
jgi:hypothetical protein